MEFSKRVKQLPPYLFVGISRAIQKKRQQGIDVVSFGIGDPDMPTPDPVIEALLSAAKESSNHRYPESEGLPEFREAVAGFYKRRFGVELNPATDIINLIGAKEGIANISFCLLDEGDVAIIPDPAYPVYTIGTMFAGGTVYKLPLIEENSWLPDLYNIPSEVADKAKVIWINYPNNPTGGVADLQFFKEIVDFAKQHSIVVLHDAAYTEIAYNGYRPPSILQVPGAKDVSVEFHSLSKTASMTGWRSGMAVGNADIIDALMRFKSNIDSGSPMAIQKMCIAALNLSDKFTRGMVSIYAKRRDKIVSALRSIGLSVQSPKAGLYVWVNVPSGYTSAEFTAYLLDEADVVVTPGSGYGSAGEGYIRLSLTVTDIDIDKGIARLSKLSAFNK